MDPKEFVKEALEAIVRNKLFALTAIVLVTISLTGCGPTLQQRRMEIQRVALEGAKEARDKANKRIDDFFYCMIRYAQKNAQVSATASEVAEAALSACQFDLELYKMSISHYHFCMGSVNATSIKSLDWARDRAEEKARLDAQELAEEGKRRVINILVKMRQ